MALLKRRSAEAADSREGEIQQKKANDIDVEQLTVELRSTEAGKRRRAARDLYGEKTASPALLAALKEEDSHSVREAILDSLLSIGDEYVAIGLLPFLNSQQASLRNSVIEVLQSMPDAVAGHIESLLKDTDPDIRIFALDILAFLPHEQVPEWVEHVLENEAHVNVLGVAIDRAAQIADESFIDALKQVRQDWQHEQYIVFACDIALSRIEQNGSTGA